MQIIHVDSRKNSYSKCIRSFINDTGMPLNIAADALSLKSSEFMKWWASSDSKLVAKKQITSLSQYISIDEEKIIHGIYDKELVRSRLFKNKLALPEEYSSNQYSYLRSSAHIMRYVSMSRGQYFADQVLRKMSISPIIYQNQNNKISLNYFIDLLDILEKNGFSQNELDTLASVMFLGIGETPIGQKFRKAKTYYECYKVLASNLDQFDSNFSYTFNLDFRRFQLKAFLPYEKHFHTNLENRRLKNLLRYRQILLGWFPRMSDLTPILPETTISFYTHGVESEYIVNFSEMNPNQLFLIPQEFHSQMIF